MKNTKQLRLDDGRRVRLECHLILGSYSDEPCHRWYVSAYVAEPKKRTFNEFPAPQRYGSAKSSCHKKNGFKEMEIIGLIGAQEYNVFLMESWEKIKPELAGDE